MIGEDEMTKTKALNDLYQKYKNEFEDKEIVLGDGNVNSQLLLIGEAPGKEEVKLSKPFVGMAGKNLSEFLEILKIDRQSIYITNAIKYRLSKVNEKTGRTVNRPATQDEIKKNREYLLQEIDIIKPIYIVTLGNVPLRAITDDYNKSIGEVHGAESTILILKKKYFLFPLYHPASIIYRKSLKDIYVKDVEKLKNIIKEKASESLRKSFSE